MNNIRRCNIDLEHKIDCSPARAIGPEMMQISEHDFLINDGNHFLTGIHNSDRGRVITIIVARDPSSLPHGMGLVYQLSVEEARATAAGLIGLADQIESEAAALAKDALARAARPGAAA